LWPWSRDRFPKAAKKPGTEVESMLTAIMIAMFYVGTAAGVMGSVLMGTFTAGDSAKERSLDDVVTDIDELSRAA
jgi:hypothetical protein